MDELFSLSSSCSPLSPSASFSTAGNPMLEFMSCDVPEQWLLDDDSAWAVAAGSSPSAGSGMRLVDTPVKRRGRRPGRRSDSPVISHIEAERQRRKNLNRRFCDLRAAVPKVTRMDKASLLADATAYIGELRGRVEKLEADVKQATSAQNCAPITEAPSIEEQLEVRMVGQDAAAVRTDATAYIGELRGRVEKLEADAKQAASAQNCPPITGAPSIEEQLEVRMVGQDAAAVRMTSTAAPHATARLMVALRALDLPVQHASVSRIGAVTVQDTVVDVPARPMQDESYLRAALLHKMQQS